MEHQPAISIVLPTYNGSKYIRTSIESCLNQTFKDFELIIVNDCSTDDTPHLIEEYATKDNRIVVIHNAINKKLPLSLNTGFDVARGKYHTWTSDDNYYAPTALETMFNILEKEKNIDLVYCDYFLINDAGEIKGTRKFNNVYDQFTNWEGCGACFLYKKEIYKVNNGYNPSAFMIEDYDFFVRAFVKFNFYYLPKHDLYYYREHATSLTSTQGDMVNDLSKIMVERQINNLAKKLPPQQLALLYRKFAVYNAVQKNNTYKYKLYLNKMGAISKKQTFITIFYVPLIKLWNTIRVGVSGIGAFLRLLFGGK
jgi:glycosyltransferase involved in cell wall biosynthesis